MTPGALRANFPDDTPLPDMLVRLCHYTEVTGLAGLGRDMSLVEDGRRSVRRAFRNYPEHIDSFIVFLTDGSGSLYGYWRYDGQPLDHAPLVYLNDAGVNNTVLASTLEDFLTLIATGQRHLGLFETWDENSEPDEDTLLFRAWLREDVGIEAPTLTQARGIVERARAAHPDLEGWMEHLVGA